jgi:hypothetical protein
MILPNVHSAYMHTLDPRLIGDGTDDVAGLDSMYRPYFDAKSFHQIAGGLGARLAWRRGFRAGAGVGAGEFPGAAGFFARPGFFE